jgi:pimeloyl-ACP methyl ester carboxylesterase
MNEVDRPGYGAPLADGIRSRFVDDVNGLRMHVLEAGHGDPRRPCLLLLHGFPELAYSWRKVILPLAAAGFHVVAPDQRGYGRTTGWDGDYDGELGTFRYLNLVRDALGLVFALGHGRVAAVVGHDFGSPVAAYCALVRPDVFRSVALMSAPFAGPPSLAFSTAGATVSSSVGSVHDDLAALEPPRKHYQWYYSTREADATSPTH